MAFTVGDYNDDPRALTGVAFAAECQATLERQNEPWLRVPSSLERRRGGARSPDVPADKRLQ